MVCPNSFQFGQISFYTPEPNILHLISIADHKRYLPKWYLFHFSLYIICVKIKIIIFLFIYCFFQFLFISYFLIAITNLYLQNLHLKISNSFLIPTPSYFYYADKFHQISYHFISIADPNEAYQHKFTITINAHLGSGTLVNQTETNTSKSRSRSTAPDRQQGHQLQIAGCCQIVTRSLPGQQPYLSDRNWNWNWSRRRRQGEE